MLTSLLLTAVCTAGGVGLFGLMHTRRDPYYGAVGLMTFCVAGTASVAYGVLHSAV